MEKQKLDDILKEIWCADELKVKISQGKIRSICKQVIQRPKYKGIDTEHRISEVIEVEGDWVEIDKNVGG